MPRLKLKTTREKGLLSALTETEIKDRTTSNKRKEIELAKPNLVRPSSIWDKTNNRREEQKRRSGKRECVVSQSDWSIHPFA